MGDGMSRIVKTVACIVSVPAITFGIYVMMHGHLTPGGGFPGGAVMATIVALFLVAFGGEIVLKSLHTASFSLLEGFGLILFITVAFLGISSTFFHNFLANSGGVFGSPVPFGSNPGHINTGGLIPVMNLAVGLEVSAALSLIVLLMFAGSMEDEDD